MSMKTQLQILCALILGIAALGVVHGQQSGKPYNVQGTVINSATGSPIPRVLLIVEDLTPRMALTDASGHFELAGIRTEPVQIRVGKSGFLDAGGLSSAASMEHPAIEVNSQTDSVVIKLSPASAIHGRITSATGVPLEAVPLSLFYRGPLGGEDLLFNCAQATTDEDGFFRFNDLIAGQYFVQAGPMLGTPLVPVEHSRIPLENYGAVFYPGVSDRHAATPIELGFGQDVAIDLSLSSVRLFSVHGQVTGWPTGDNGALQFMPSAGTYFNYDSKLDLATGKFRISQVTPGAYTIHVLAADGTEAEQELTVDSDISGLKLSLSQPRRIPVFLHASDRRAEGGSIRMTLKPKDKWKQAVDMALRRGPADEAIFLHAPVPGEYRVHFAGNPPLHVTAATCGTIDLLQQPLVVTGEGMAPIDITLGYDSATLGGQVRLQGRSVSAYVVIVPIDPGGETRVEYAVEGRFAGLQLAPGRYHVWAFDRPPKYFREAETMKPYASQAQVVTLAANQKIELPLEMLKAKDE